MSRGINSTAGLASYFQAFHEITGDRIFAFIAIFAIIADRPFYK